MKNKNIKNKSISNGTYLMVVVAAIVSMIVLTVVTSDVWMPHNTNTLKAISNKSEIDSALDSFLGTTGESAKALKWFLHTFIAAVTIGVAIFSFFKIAKNAHNWSHEDIEVAAKAKRNVGWAIGGLVATLLITAVIEVVLNVVGTHTGFQKTISEVGSGSSGANPSLIIDTIVNSFVLK